MNAHLTPAQMVNVLRDEFGITHDPDITTATSDDDGPVDRVYAELDLLAMADEMEARETAWREGGAA